MSSHETRDIAEERISTGNRAVEIKENKPGSGLAWMFEVVHASLPRYLPRPCAS